MRPKNKYRHLYDCTSSIRRNWFQQIIIACSLICSLRIFPYTVFHGVNQDLTPRSKASLNCLLRRKRNKMNKRYNIDVINGFKIILWKTYEHAWPGLLYETAKTVAKYSCQGYKRKKEFIITQMPLSTTKTDLWRLVEGHDVNIIVMMNTLSEAKVRKHCSIYRFYKIPKVLVVLCS